MTLSVYKLIRQAKRFEGVRIKKPFFLILFSGSINRSHCIAFQYNLSETTKCWLLIQGLTVANEVV